MLVVVEEVTNMKALLTFVKKQKVPLETVIKGLLFKRLSQCQTLIRSYFKQVVKYAKQFV